VPIGKAKIELKVIPFAKSSDKPVKKTDEQLTPHTDALLNIFSNMRTIN